MLTSVPPTNRGWLQTVNYKPDKKTNRFVAQKADNVVIIQDTQCLLLLGRCSTLERLYRRKTLESTWRPPETLWNLPRGLQNYFRVCLAVAGLTRTSLRPLKKDGRRHAEATVSPAPALVSPAPAFYARAMFKQSLPTESFYHYFLAMYTFYCGKIEGVGGTEAGESALRSTGTLLSRVRAPPPAP
ncbi:hypothetical protein PoB_007322100 [Plakobranchus ocellatus]|uniref:Uncharacterized protein n=1 Tax=Plakobranchus ocellatus TaxID=259542 RepID=A0AAV4DRG4_9GAST|nr:hypothetical protein PoB_007322100 [Plakobranchus ocellatus]